MRRRFWCGAACAVMLLALVGCGMSGTDYGQSRDTTPTASSQPVAPLALNMPYQEGGVTITMTAYERHVDPATVPFDPNKIPQGEHFVRMDYTLHNTTNHDLEIETRLRVSQGGLTIDIPPDVINGQETYTVTHAVVYQLDVVRAQAVAERTVYYLIQPNVQTMALYLNLWTPGKQDFQNLPPLFTVEVAAT